MVLCQVVSSAAWTERMLTTRWLWIALFLVFATTATAMADVGVVESSPIPATQPTPESGAESSTPEEDATASDENPIISPRLGLPPGPALPGAVWTARLLAVVLMLPFFWLVNGREMRLKVLWTGAASLLTRIWVPFVPLHVQTDDLRLVATARGAPGIDLAGSNSADGLILPLFRGALALWGDNLDSAFLVGHVTGILLPVLALVLAWQWLRDSRQAATVAVLVLISPVAWIYSGAITAYMPAAALFAASLIVAMTAAGDSGRGVSVVATASASLLLPCVLLKPEFLVLLPIHAWLASLGTRRPVLLLPAVAVTITVAVFSAPYLSDFWSKVAYRTDPIGVAWTGHLLVYAVLGILLLNPPFLPLKLAFLSSLRRPRGRDLRSLQVACVALLAVFSLAKGSVGFNQWRYSLIFLVPFSLVIAPTLLRWWDTRPRTFGTVAALGAVLVFNIGGLGWYTHRLPSRPDPGLFAAADLDAQSLILYAPHPGDSSPAYLMGAIGAPQSLPLDELWPAACATGEALRLVGPRIDAWDLARQFHETGAHEMEIFMSVESLDGAIRWLMDLSLEPWAVETVSELETTIDRHRSQVDPTRCETDLARLERALAEQRRILLFVDHAVAQDLAWARFGRGHRGLHEYFELAASRLDLAESTGWDETRLVEVHAIRDDSNGLIWEAR